ncbi:pyroglutamyl-peptidase I [Amycolatopsis sp. PS_44_ISF1]|uniref:pyroglutamyl-peptidase I n=1 Tax=Amycolatopsis sp. PS_44_ISF1 TaxID=2974917 RepID=UPI0037BFF9DD
MTVLMTGFEPFNGSAINPSWEAVSLAAERHREVVAVRLPCEFDTTAAALRAAIERHRPDVVVCVGQAGRREEVTPEYVAINVLDTPIPDNVGTQPRDLPVLEGGPAAYFTSLPVKAAATAIRAAGIPGSVSYTAGTTGCNHAFYCLMHLLATEFLGLRGGFVHVPFSPEQSAARGTGPSLPIEQSAAALQIVVETALSTGEDAKASAGALH